MADSVVLSLGSGHFGGGIPFLGVKTRCIDKSTGEHYDTRQDNSILICDRANAQFQINLNFYAE